MEQGVLYGVGVGPGDPELMTCKAVRILREADVVAVPDTGPGEQTALRIAGSYTEGKPLLRCTTPMVRDRTVLDAAYDRIAEDIEALLARGRTVAFLTLGDPSIYSTYLHVHRRVLEAGYEARIVPGVPSFCAVAARLGQGLCEGGDRLLIVPASHQDVSDCLEVDANLVFMKAGRETGKLRRMLEKRGMLGHAAMVENCGMETERVYPRFADAPEGGGYFSVVVVKREGR